MNAMNGRSTSGTTGLGTVEVSGRSLVPSPPARIRACIARRRGSTPPDPLVAQPGVERVAPVDDHVARHALCGRGPVEVAELLPLRDEHGGVGVLERLERRAR